MKFLKDKHKHIFLLFLFIVSSVCVFSQNNIPNKPDFIPALIDSTNTLNIKEKAALERKLMRYSDSTSTEMFLMILPSTNGENISLYATELGHKWEIGQKGKDNGIVIVVAKDDRKIAIQTGYGIEYLLTDAFSKRIIENIIIPEFKRGNYYVGLDKGIDVIIDVLKGEYKGTPKKNKKSSGPPIVLIIILIFFILSILSNNNKRGGRGGGKRNTASDILTAILLSGAGRGNFGGGSSGGGFGSGGFGGFGGGGSFGGGGASGSW